MIMRGPRAGRAKAFLANAAFIAVNILFWLLFLERYVPYFKRWLN
jgi:hypothetical protein